MAENEGTTNIPGTGQTVLNPYAEAGGDGGDPMLPDIGSPDLNLPKDFQPDSPNPLVTPRPAPESPQNNPQPGNPDSTQHDPDDASNPNIFTFPPIPFGTPKPPNKENPNASSNPPEPTPPPSDGRTLDQVLGPPDPPLTRKEIDEMTGNKGPKGKIIDN